MSSWTSGRDLEQHPVFNFTRDVSCVKCASALLLVACTKDFSAGSRVCARNVPCQLDPQKHINLCDQRKVFVFFFFASNVFNGQSPQDCRPCCPQLPRPWIQPRVGMRRFLPCPRSKSTQREAAHALHVSYTAIPLIKAPHSAAVLHRVYSLRIHRRPPPQWSRALGSWTWRRPCLVWISWARGYGTHMHTHALFSWIQHLVTASFGQPEEWGWAKGAIHTLKNSGGLGGLQIKF